VENLIEQGFMETQKDYTNNRNDVVTVTWDDMQKNFNCCGTTNYTTWSVSPYMSRNNSVPDSCCKDFKLGCGYGQNLPGSKLFFDSGCVSKISTILRGLLVIVGAIAAAVAILELIGIIFAFSLAHSLRKDYRVV